MPAQLRAILILPFNVLVTVPALIVWWTDGGPLVPPTHPAFWAALAAAAIGLSLMVSTIRRFSEEGEGTLAPWEPTRKLVVSGPYRYVRNPMISGVLFNLAAEALALRSVPIAGWLAFFFLGNTLYFVLFEEPGLEARFGDDYRRYRAAVPRWIPRLRPYSD